MKMLYVLPPLRTQNSPVAHWNGILCSTSTSTTSNNANNNAHDNVERHNWKEFPPRVRLRNLQIVDTGEDEKKDEIDLNRNPKSLSECYFAGKGTALELPDAEANNSKSSRRSGNGSGGGGSSSNIQKHLQSMFYLLRPEEKLKMAVKLESVHPSRTRYLVVVSRMGSRGEESCLLGIDCNERTTVGLVLKVLADTKITLDGDGGFSVSVCDRHHIFKPVSVQAMWSALQTLHKVSAKAREENYFQGGVNHGWVNYYNDKIESDRSCVNEWDAMDDLESKRPPSPDSIRSKPTKREETECLIRTKLKEIMMTVDLDEVTSKVIRSKLEEQLNMDLAEYKPFIDETMLFILGQMDAPTEIFEHVYLGSEWNASNYEELQKNGVGHILNVTREIDNFFPGTFDYLNVRVYDDEKTDLLKHWDDTYKYITKAKNNGSKVLVHCKMGVSRSASVVIAYAMKAYNWDLETALRHVKEKRTCIKPNTSFVSQLETYQGILDAMKNKEKLQRSKSETNLKRTDSAEASLVNGGTRKINNNGKVLVGSEPTPVVQALSKSFNLDVSLSGQDLRSCGTRPKSWSPDNAASRVDIGCTGSGNNGGKVSPLPSLSLENLSQKSSSKESVKSLSHGQEASHVLLPCDNGESYSVSPNRIVHLPESGQRTKKLVMDLATRFENRVGDSVNNNSTGNNNNCDSGSLSGGEGTICWDPGEKEGENNNCQKKPVISSVCDSDSTTQQPIWTSSVTINNSGGGSERVPESPVREDPFSNQLDSVFYREEEKANPPSRQNSWSSYDSAVAFPPCEGAELSRHSSWGSGDTRANLLSRNSSWGSYDMRPRDSVHYVNEKGERVQHNVLVESSSSGIFPYDKEDIPWHPGTVKRTKQKIEGRHLVGSEEDKLMDEEIHFSAISRKIDVPQRHKFAKPNSSRLSKSAPEPSSMKLAAHHSQQVEQEISRSATNVPSVINTSQVVSVKQHRNFLEETLQNQSLANKQRLSATAIDEASLSVDQLGKVRNLKKEFEAKSVPERRKKVNSLPSSPVSLHIMQQEKIKSEDLNLKSLIGIFEESGKALLRDRKQRIKPGHGNGGRGRHSCIEVTVEKTPRIAQTPLITNLTNAKLKGENCRPPLKPAPPPPQPPLMRNSASQALVESVIATAATKKQKQYGSTHPLSRLNAKPRHNNPVYNTM